MALGEFAVSDNADLLAYTTDNVGFRQYKLHIKDLRTGKLLAETAERVDSLAWAADNKSLFYTTEDATTKRSNLMYRHALGTDSTLDPVVLNEKDERYDLSVFRTRDRKYLLRRQQPRHQRSSLPADAPTAEWSIVEPRNEGVRYDVDEGNGRFYIRVNDTDPSSRLVTAPVASPGKAHWTEVIAGPQRRAP